MTSADERWQRLPAPRRFFLLVTVMFGALGVLDAALFLTSVAGGAWTAAAGLGIALNALFWYRTWHTGSFRRPGTVVLAVLALAVSIVVLTLGLDALSTALHGGAG